MKYCFKSVSGKYVLWAVLFLISGGAGVLILSPTLFKTKQFPSPYLLLVSFYSGHVNDFGSDKIQALNESPYHGVAVPLIGAYDTGKYTENDFESAVTRFKKESKKNILPWIFFNRFIGYNDDGRSLSKAANSEYFRAIKGMDINNEAGAFEDFLNIYRISLKIVKELGSPGIVIDPEAYNNYKCYQLSYLSKQTGKSEEDTKQALKKMGEKLTDIADEIYPDATLWFLFTGLGSPVRTFNPFAEKKYRSITYIVQGMLDRAKEKKLKLKIVSGGELYLGYCNKSFDHLKEKIKERDQNFNAFLSKYQNLKAGGTISPWYDAKLKRGWMIEYDDCRDSILKDIIDFKTLFNLLFEKYNYVWIYAAEMAPYNPYSPELSLKYNKVISESFNLNTR